MVNRTLTPVSMSLIHAFRKFVVGSSLLRTVRTTLESNLQHSLTARFHGQVFCRYCAVARTAPTVPTCKAAGKNWGNQGFAKNGPFFHLGSSKNGSAAQDFNPSPKIRVS